MITTRSVLCGLSAIGVCSALMAAASGPAASAVAFDAAWNANGATACERFLTPAVMSAVLNDPSGAPAKDTATSCHRGSIYITLQSTNPATLKQQIPRIAFAHPVAGIGDVAFWNDAGTTTAAKAPDRGCVIQAVLAVATHQTKITNEVLAQKLGAVCNQLFALK